MSHKRKEDIIISEPKQNPTIIIPPYEDLSLARSDEETVLRAVYEDDFECIPGVWGVQQFNIKCRPDTDAKNIGSTLTLSVQLNKKYPYAPPTIQLNNVKGLLVDEEKEMLQILKDQATKLSTSGSVFVCDLVQSVEEYLLEHNKDPMIYNLSAWEKNELQEEEKRKKREEERRLNNLRNNSFQGIGSNSDHFIGETSVNEEDIKRELDRQIEAIGAAAEGRRRIRSDSVFSCNSGNKNEHNSPMMEDEEDEEYDYDNYQDYTRTPTSSRYRNDFIEKGLLGKGGGGEVVLARNRLDRRLYAVKKIILQAERGRLAKYNAIQNRKLTREVTTISRMTYKYIVRYYQAWVEGGIDDASSEDHSSSRKNSDSKEEGSIAENENERQNLFQNEGNNNDSSWWDTSNDDAISDDYSTWTADESSDTESNEDQVSLADVVGDLDLTNPMKDMIRFSGWDNENDKNNDHSPKKESFNTDDQSFDDDNDVTSEHRIDPNSNQRILYIQMEYCSSTLHHIINDGSVYKMDINEKWRLIRQILEALVYIHQRKIIHRDLKPSNLFIDSEDNIKLGDFGLATKDRMSQGHNTPNPTTKNEDEGDHNNINIKEDSVRSLPNDITIGVGTAYYRAPEQESFTRREKHPTNNQDKGSHYDVNVDIFSLGIIIFEMFHPPFDTGMERFQILTRLRGDSNIKGKEQEQEGVTETTLNSTITTEVTHTNGFINDDWRVEASQRFPKEFCDTVNENAQKMILWCLRKSPFKRPSATDLLSSDLLPRKMELEGEYLKEALDIILGNNHSKSYDQILSTMFAQPIPNHIEILYDTDVAVKANALMSRKRKNPKDLLLDALLKLRESNTQSAIEKRINSTVLSPQSMNAAAFTLMRARNAVKYSRYNRSVAGKTIQSLAMKAATTQQITGLSGADPDVVEYVITSLKEVFQSHGALFLRPPLLRPRLKSVHNQNTNVEVIGCPAELLDERGTVLTLPENLTANFARQIARGGHSTASVKRYDIDKVYHKGLASTCHPKEAYEASFDIVVSDNPLQHADYIEAESFMVLCQSLARLLPSSPETQKNHQHQVHQVPAFFVCVSHTRLTDSILDLCGVPQDESIRKKCLKLISSVSMHPISNALSKKSQLKPQIPSFEEYGFSQDVALNLKTFFSNGCLPLPLNIGHALENLGTATKELKKTLKINTSTEQGRRKMRRCDEIGKSILSLRRLVQALRTFGILRKSGDSQDDFDSTQKKNESFFRIPDFILIDLGLRQKSKQMHGHLFFQAYILPSFLKKQIEKNPMVSNDVLLRPHHDHHSCIKVAEGGRYDNLVRRYRPPGNLGSMNVNHYSNIQNPICMGIRFFVGKLVECIFKESVITNNNANFSSTEVIKDELDMMRKSLGYPIQFVHPIQCIVASYNGFDAASLHERALVTARLWRHGIPSDYFPHSGVITNLFQQNLSLLASKSMGGSLKQNIKDQNQDDAWNLDHIFGICRYVQTVISLHLFLSLSPSLLVLCRIRTKFILCYFLVFFKYLSLLLFNPIFSRRKVSNLSQQCQMPPLDISIQVMKNSYR